MDYKNNNKSIPLVENYIDNLPAKTVSPLYFKSVTKELNIQFIATTAAILLLGRNAAISNAISPAFEMPKIPTPCPCFTSFKPKRKSTASSK